MASKAEQWKRHQLPSQGDATPLLQQQAGGEETDSKTGGRMFEQKQSHGSSQSSHLQSTDWSEETLVTVKPPDFKIWLLNTYLSYK